MSRSKTPLQAAPLALAPMAPTKFGGDLSAVQPKLRWDRVEAFAARWPTLVLEIVGAAEASILAGADRDQVQARLAALPDPTHDAEPDLLVALLGELVVRKPLTNEGRARLEALRAVEPRLDIGYQWSLDEHRGQYAFAAPLVAVLASEGHPWRPAPADTPDLLLEDLFERAFQRREAIALGDRNFLVVDGQLHPARRAPSARWTFADAEPELPNYEDLTFPVSLWALFGELQLFVTRRSWAPFITSDRTSLQAEFPTPAGPVWLRASREEGTWLDLEGPRGGFSKRREEIAAWTGAERSPRRSTPGEADFLARFANVVAHKLTTDGFLGAPRRR